MVDAATASPDKANEDDLDEIDDIKADFRIHEEAWEENRRNFLDDIRFGREEEQWPEQIRRQREQDGRPCLTLNQLHTFIFQVINSARQNKPGIIVHPVGSGADVEVAELFNGLIRHIEQSSDGDVAYDTAMDSSVSGGFGFWRVNTRYACDDTFEQDIILERIFDASSVFPDAHSTAADSSDWNRCHILFSTPKTAFEKKYPGEEAVSFDGEVRSQRLITDEDQVQLCERWTREEVPRTITALSAMDPTLAMAMPSASADATAMAGQTMIVDMKVYEDNQALFDAMGMKPVGKPREVKSYKVTQQICSGAAVLETVDWAGTYIPIVPVWGEELSVEGKRILRSLIRGAKDAQRMYNYWKPLALDTVIPTPTGWTTMGEIQAGDSLFDETGAICRVVGKSPVHINRQCYRVEFDDGSSIVADAEHPWFVEERGKRQAKTWAWTPKIVSTSDLSPKTHFIHTAKPLLTDDVDLPIDPYLLGVWLGDGDTAAPRITQGAQDVDEIRDNLSAVGCALSDSRLDRNGVSRFTVYGIRAEFVKAGLLGNKHIPTAYLRASKAQREQLLRGLMDTDGSITAARQCSFTTTLPALAEGFAELTRSLGIKAVRCNRVGRAVSFADGHISQGADSVQFSFSCGQEDDVFSLTRKRSIQRQGAPRHQRRTKRHAIVAVTPVSSVPVQCVAVDSSSHLFLAGQGMVPTHNTTSTELVALAPKTPFIGKRGAFETDNAKWATANTENHAYIEYDGNEMPQRQPFASVPTGAIQEAASAQSDIKNIVGIFNSSIGAQSNETSGVAIDARDKQADTGSFHFTDNLSRAMRHCGRILLDLIPRVYSTARVLRILMPDGKAQMVPVNQTFQQPVMGPDGNPAPQIDPTTGQPATDANGQPIMKSIEKIFDLTVGKYDLVVKAGPSFATQRDEIVQMCTEIIRVFPAAAPVLADLIFRNYDMPGADEIADRLYALMPQQAKGEDPRIQQGMQLINALKQKVAQLQGDQSYDQGKLHIDAFKAQTDRIEALAPDGVPMDPSGVQAMVIKSIQAIIANPDLLISEQPMDQGAPLPPLGAGPMPGATPMPMGQPAPAPQPQLQPVGQPGPMANAV